MTKEHVWERPGVWGAPVHSTLCVRSQRGAARRRTASVEVEWVVLVALTLDWSRRLAWAGALGWPGMWKAAVGFPWARGTFGSRLGVGTEVKSGPVVSCSLSSVTVHVHWYAMGGVPAVAQVFLLAYDTVTSLQIRRCEPRWSASPETVRDFGP